MINEDRTKLVGSLREEMCVTSGKAIASLINISSLQ